jgi:hypothetical protein
MAAYARYLPDVTRTTNREQVFIAALLESDHRLSINVFNNRRIVPLVLPNVDTYGI